MNILVTAGNTQVMIDRVRCITNIFSGRTGAHIALRAHARGHAVTLLTSHPEAVAYPDGVPPVERWTVRRYRTFEDLQKEMQAAISLGGLDAVVHCAAVSDYQSAGVHAPASDTFFDENDGRWMSTSTAPPAMLDRSAGKVKSDEPELWLRLVRTPKLIDSIRTHWGFHGVLVKFKLEVGVADAQLLEIAERSRLQSEADLMVANTLEGSAAWAYLGPREGAYQLVSRRDLPDRLLEAIEDKYKERSHG